MPQRRVVIASAPDGLRAAGALAARGYSVLLLQSGPTPSGLRDAAVPIQPDRFSLWPHVAALAEDTLGPVLPCLSPRRALAAGNRVVPLPIPPWAVPGFVPSAERQAAASDWLRARVRNGLAEVLGGGQEERSYRDWVVRRMGEPAWRSLYQPYARARWGEDSTLLSSVLARWAHALPPDDMGVAVADGVAASRVHSCDRITAAGGEIRVQAAVARLVVDGDHVSAVELSSGEQVPVDGPLWVAAPPRQIADWLGESAPVAAQVDARRLPVADAVRVAFFGDSVRLSADQDIDELHVVSQDLPLWRITVHRGSDCAVVAHLTVPLARPLPPDAPLVGAVADRLAQLGVLGVNVGSARVERLPSWEPVWVRRAHATLRPVLQAWEALGLVPIGRSGAFAPLDLGGELALAAHCMSGDQAGLLEAQRTLVSAPARLDDLDARITRFVGR